MDDQTLFALCVWDEASGEPYEGKVAVARVIHNRMAAKYQSDGTVAGTVLKKFQFSGFWFTMEDGKYTQTEFDAAGAEAQAERLLVQATGARNASCWADCLRAVAQADPKNPTPWAKGLHPEWDKLAAEPRALLYCNPAISHPTWATPKAQVAVIFHHTFYKG